MFQTLDRFLHCNESTLKLQENLEIGLQLTLLCVPLGRGLNLTRTRADSWLVSDCILGVFLNLVKIIKTGVRYLIVQLNLSISLFLSHI